MSQRSTSSPFSSREQLLVELLRRRLSRLSYLALLLVVERVLREAGYSNIRLLGRRHLRGRTRSGGADMSASGEMGQTQVATLVQVKNYVRPVSRRFVDELRGVILRRGVPEGFLITTSIFSKQAIQATLHYPGRPIRLMDGHQLASTILRAGLGITETQDLLSGERAKVLDEAAFRELERVAETMQSAS